jgi:cellulose synthase/poly-beta-1,6-N-acetylglucosamine synthase-like glycosyltransferase
MGADGSLFAIRRALHRNVPEDMIDDMHLSFSIMCDGHRVVRAGDVKAYEEATLTMAEEFRRKVRIACQAFNVNRLLWPRLRQMDALSLYKYVSHRLLRWLSIYSLALSFLCFEAAAAAAGFALPGVGLAVIAAIVLYVGHRWQIKPFAQCWEVLVTLTAVGVGVWRSLRGEKFQTWTPAASVRK